MRRVVIGSRPRTGAGRPLVAVAVSGALVLGTLVAASGGAAAQAAAPSVSATADASAEVSTDPVESAPEVGIRTPPVTSMPVGTPPAKPRPDLEAAVAAGADGSAATEPRSRTSSTAARSESAGGATRARQPKTGDLALVNSFAGGTESTIAGGDSPYFPPDTVGDVGPNHYVQMLNTSFTIYDKQGNLLTGPTPNNSLWADPSFTGCRTTNNGDPIVLYDQAADRWMLSQFSVTGGPLQMCIAYSQTPDPTGAYYAYEFDVPAFPDYPKFGVWPDGLYMSTYQDSFLGAYVFDRTAMLAGQVATYQYSAISSGGGPRQQRILPADWDGTAAPPAGAPNPFLMSVDADIQGGDFDRLELWNFHVDWATPANSSFSLTQTLPTDPFSIDIGSDCTGASFATFRRCVPQPGTGMRVDDIANRLMWRLQYRNFGTHQAMVTNQTVNSGNDTAAVRWYELRSTGAGWSIFQQGTFAPSDAAYRWMGSAAMDKLGNIALGYSISDATSIYPSIAVTGHQAGSTPGQMSEGEILMYSGTASQTASSRWGDYSAMSVDPVDDCTFWYTQMHIGAGNARLTRIGTLRFATCAAAVAPTVSIDIAGESPTWSTADPTVGTVTASAGGALTISSLACTGGVRGPVSGLGTATATASLTVTGQGDSPVSCTATDSLGQTGSDAATVRIDSVPPVVTVQGPADGQLYPANAVPPATCLTTDATSGVAVPASLQLTGPTGGIVTATCSGAVDVAGNPQAAPVVVRFAVAGIAFVGTLPRPISSASRVGQRVPFQFVLTDLAGQRIPSPLVNPIRVRVVLMPTKLGPVVSAAPCARRPGTYALSCSLPLVPEPMPKPYPVGGVKYVTAVQVDVGTGWTTAVARPESSFPSTMGILLVR